ncbi:50S ribosomal protein L15 [bacterium]|jgi:large subunit ribosomal protein L15|nr:50S ribosomal protein L15 [bacterium]MBT4649512.1 50S ribosomal protein L15 [bacterium]
MLGLHNLKAKHKGIKAKRRVGRGNATGKGTYSTRGMKGQRSRSGGKSGLTARSMKSYLLRIPKVRGFNSLNKKFACVNVRELQTNFKDGATINARGLLKAGLIDTINNGIKILSLGEISKKFNVEADAFSEAAKVKIEKAGGKIVLVGKKSIKESLNKAKDKQDA